jgi:hypothetical protein
MNVEWKNRSQDPIEKRFEDLLEVSTCPLAYEIYNVHPLALQMHMRQSDGDTPTFKDILKMDADERSKWYDAMDAELSSLFEHDCFDVIPISESSKPTDRSLHMGSSQELSSRWKSDQVQGSTLPSRRSDA